jgi:hypothetical protein
MIWVERKQKYFCKRGWTAFGDLPDEAEIKFAIPVAPPDHRDPRHRPSESTG